GIRDCHVTGVQTCALPIWTICIHPFPGSFFGRDRVLPNLGFDVFLDIAAFQEARRFGPYVSDLSVAEKIIEVLRLPGGPKFVFRLEERRVVHDVRASEAPT